MIEVSGNLWTYGPVDFRVITTNGARRRDGCAVMGRGCAAEAKAKYPELPALLGNRLRLRGNHVHFFSRAEITPAGEAPRRDLGLFTFPVKHVWDQPADLALIAQSVAEFKQQLLESARYVIPRPGCGNGQLSWEVVRPLLVGLPDNVVVIDFAK